jgi:hypothetical protein
VGCSVLDALNRTGLLDDVRNGQFNLALLHVLGPNAASLSEISEIAKKLGAGAMHLLVKNYVHESGFDEWHADARFTDALNNTASIVIPHLPGRVCTEVQQLGLSFSSFTEQSQSRMMIGHVRAWLRDVYAQLAVLDPLIDETR